MTTTAVIITRNRPEEYASCYAAIAAQVDKVATVMHMPPGEVETDYSLGDGVTYYRGPTNISTMWNMGLRWCRDHWHSSVTVVLNDDALVPPGWVDRVIDAMDNTGSAIGGSRGGTQGHTVDSPGFYNVGSRVPGWAFIVGDSDVWADEELVWWGSEDAMQLWVLHHGGRLVVLNGDVPNLHANETTVGFLAEQAGRDKETMMRKYGWSW